MFAKTQYACYNLDAGEAYESPNRADGSYVWPVLCLWAVADPDGYCLFSFQGRAMVCGQIS